MVDRGIHRHEPANSTRSSVELFAGVSGLPRDGAERSCRTGIGSALADGRDGFTAGLRNRLSPSAGDGTANRRQSFAAGLCDGAEEFSKGFSNAFCQRRNKQNADAADCRYQ